MEIIGTSAQMLEVFDLISKAANSNARVLITGERGTGKKLVAKAIHQRSLRKDKNFIILSCGVGSENLLISELFGHVRGAFDGAAVDKKSLLEIVDGGTLFIDEIWKLPLRLQVKLLEFIEEGEFKRLGGTKKINVDVRIISSTSTRDLEKKFSQSELLQDLYYRLNVIRINLPPLRERKEDIHLLVNYFIRKYSLDSKNMASEISSEAMTLLLGYNFPGNITELENIIERGIALEDSPIIAEKHIRFFLNERIMAKNVSVSQEIPDEGIDLNKAVEDLEKAYLLKAMKKTGGVKNKAAELLGMDFRALRYKLQKYGL